MRVCIYLIINVCVNVLLALSLSLYIYLSDVCVSHGQTDTGKVSTPAEPIVRGATCRGAFDFILAWRPSPLGIPFHVRARWSSSSPARVRTLPTVVFAVSWLSLHLQVPQEVVGVLVVDVVDVQTFVKAREAKSDLVVEGHPHEPGHDHLVAATLRPVKDQRLPAVLLASQCGHAGCCVDCPCLRPPQGELHRVGQPAACRVCVRCLVA